MAPLAPKPFVSKYLPLAQQWEAKTGIPASMYLAIIASESNWGNADNALFGVKGKGTAGSFTSASWEGPDKQHRTDTVDDFRNYNSANEAFQGFWDFLHQNPRYSDALKLLPNDPTAFLYAINRAGYAADQTWADSISSIQRNQIAPMIQSGGGKTMATMQEGPAIDPSLIDAAINGDTPGVPGFVPDGNVGTVDQNTPTSQQTPTAQMNGNDILQLVVDKLGPYASRVVVNPSTTTDDPVFGKSTGPTHAPTYRYTWANGKTLDVAALDSGAVVKGGTALATLSQGTAPITRTFPDGSLRQYDPDSKQWSTIAEAPASKAPKTVNTKAGTYSYDGANWTLIPGTGPANVQVHQMPDGSLQQYDPDSGQWTMIQPRYVDPSEQAYKDAQTASLQANTAKTQMSLRPVAQQAFIEADASIKAIADQYASGQISLQEANSLSKQVHDGIAATIAGTTLFEQQKQAQDTQTQRASQASNYLQQRISSASSLGSSLLSAATGHVLLPKGQKTLGIDPFAIANQEVNTMGGGQSTGDAAAAFLKAALGGQAGGTPAPGAPVQSPFPTTREAVLAQYPDLGQAPAQAPIAPVAPAAPAQTQPTPPSNIQTLLASIGQGGR